MRGEKGVIEVSAPGKLFISGEWAVLDVGNPGIVAAINKRVHVRIRESPEKNKIIVSIHDFGIKNLSARYDGKKIEWERELSEKERVDTSFIKAAMETTLSYLSAGEEARFKPFEIESWGELSQVVLKNGERKKVGFGSSAASVVATVAALLKFNARDIESKDAKERIYKLSAIAHYMAQGKIGSAFDVAASTYGGVFVYRRFDPRWLEGEISSGKSTREIVDSEWPSFRVEALEIPSDLHLLVAFTGKSASTSAMVKKLKSWAESNRERQREIYEKIAGIVRELTLAWKEKKRERIIELLNLNEDYLRELGESSGIDIETPELKTLSEVAKGAGGAGKLSGAGGGDCGIAVCFDDGVAERIRESWRKNGLYPLDVGIDKEGVRVEKGKG